VWVGFLGCHHQVHVMPEIRIVNRYRRSQMC